MKNTLNPMNRAHAQIKRILITTAVGCLLGSGLQTFGAVVTFQFNATDGSGINALGQLTTSDNGNGTFTATGGSLDVLTGPYAGDYSLVFNPAGTAVANSPIDNANPGQGVGFYFDNQYSPSQSGAVFDNDGLLFHNVAGSVEVNLWGNGGSSYSLCEGTANGYLNWGNSGTLAVPDGGLTASLLGLSLLGLGWVRRQA